MRQTQRQQLRPPCSTPTKRTIEKFCTQLRFSSILHLFSQAALRLQRTMSFIRTPPQQLMTTRSKEAKLRDESSKSSRPINSAPSIFIFSLSVAHLRAHLWLRRIKQHHATTSVLKFCPACWQVEHFGNAWHTGTHPTAFRGIRSI